MRSGLPFCAASKVGTYPPLPVTGEARQRGAVQPGGRLLIFKKNRPETLLGTRTCGKGIGAKMDCVARTNRRQSMCRNARRGRGHKLGGTWRSVRKASKMMILCASAKAARWGGMGLASGPFSRRETPAPVLSTEVCKHAASSCPCSKTLLPQCRVVPKRL